MSRPLKCSKLSEAREHETLDRISSLPDELLVDILSILPTRCAVATSILSSRWKCLHMFTNCLSFDVPYVMGQVAANAQKKSYRTFVNKVLLSHKVSPLKKFHLDCNRHNYVRSQLHTWIGVALSRRVEQLHLFMGRRPPPNALPNCLFNCQTIVELKIDSKIVDLHVPEEIHLPNLKILNFKHVHFVDYDSLPRFFSGCPLLQDLVMEYCSCANDTNRHVRVSLGELKRCTIYISKGWFEIDSPKLVYLNISCSSHPAHIVLSLRNPERLVTAHVDFNYIGDNYHLQHALVLIQAIQYVKELHLGLGIVETVQNDDCEPNLYHFGTNKARLSMYFVDAHKLICLLFLVKYLANSEDYHLPSYPNLVKLSLGRWSYNGLKHIRHLLVNSPRLETVVFNQGLNKGGVRGEKWPTDVELAPFSSCVKVIEVSQFFGYTRELVFLKYLLANADALNLLILKKWIMTDKQTLEARNKLLKFPRASKTCDIQLKEE